MNYIQSSYMFFISQRTVILKICMYHSVYLDSRQLLLISFQRHNQRVWRNSHTNISLYIPNIPRNRYIIISPIYEKYISIIISLSIYKQMRVLEPKDILLRRHLLNFAEPGRPILRWLNQPYALWPNLVPQNLRIYTESVAEKSYVENSLRLRSI